MIDISDVLRLTPKTKVDDLLSEYPFLLQYFLKQSPKFKLLQNPLTRKTIGKVATLSQVASIGGLDLNDLLAGIAREIRSSTGDVITVSGDGEAVEEPGSRGVEVLPAISRHEGEAIPSEDRAARQEILKGIIRDLHKGEDMAVLKQRFHDLVKDVDSTEIAAMEQGLIAEGMPESEIKRLCDVHVEVFKESFEREGVPEAPPGHPVNTFMLENRAAEEIVKEIAAVLDKVCDAEDEELFQRYRDDLRQLLERLSQIDLHYLRKENQLFPILEGYGIEGPSQVMWALHDDIRDALKTAKSELDSGKGREAVNTIRYAAKSIIDMIYKEEHILFPMTLETLSDADWQKVRQGEPEIGYAWIVPEEGWTVEETAEVIVPVPAGRAMLNLDTGSLALEQVNLMLMHLPLEISFVDENDEVRYYSQVKEKIFPRSPGVIGRKVQNCHPSRSLPMVQKILDEFRAGTRDAADFWIDRKGRFVYISYLAVRDAGGAYKGTLEVVQDVTGIRGLTGEKRLLDWE